MARDFPFDVFLSHNSKDKPRVCRLAERLNAAGLRVWMDEWVIQPGDIISLKVDEGLEQSQVLLLCISPTALASDWVALERSTAIHRDPANADRRFIPLLLADCKLPVTLRRYKYVDFRDEAERAPAEVPTTGLAETRAMHRRFGLPHGAIRVRQSNGTFHQLDPQGIASIVLADSNRFSNKWGEGHIRRPRTCSKRAAPSSMDKHTFRGFQHER